ncbi:MAG TPA: hypothetical protein VJZ72_11930 [Candidatus Limnocylindrales bacterium]|nr:hypothetical protein [Candidatus Limnocylindrales bacterium]
METEASGGELVVDIDSGVYGHRVTMLDFLPAFRRAGDRTLSDERAPRSVPEIEAYLEDVARRAP